jgi:glyoxylase-like metal-dependent hydrolase (beta-lactamase superfamily II)
MKEILKNIFIVKEYNPNDIDCCVYMIDTKSEDGLVLIDIGLYLDPITKIKEQGFDPMKIKHVLITHGHIDHFGACGTLKKLNKNIKFYAHELDAIKIEEIPTDDYIQQYYSDYNYEPVKLAKKIKKDNEILKFGNYHFKCIHIPGHTPGSLAFLLEIDKKKVLFGGDVPGVALDTRGGDLNEYLNSMKKILDLDIDILCEGHSNVIESSEKIKKNIKNYMELNNNLHLVGEIDPKNKHAVLDLIKAAYELEFYDNALEFCNYLLEIDPHNQEGQDLLEKIKVHKPPEIEYLRGLIKSNFEESNS